MNLSVYFEISNYQWLRYDDDYREKGDYHGRNILFSSFLFFFGKITVTQNDLKNDNFSFGDEHTIIMITNDRC